MDEPALTPAGRRSRLEAAAPALLEIARLNLTREFPHQSVLAMAGPGPVRPHRERHPAFYGSYDWHSCVEMAWVAVRLLRLFPGLAGETPAREVLNSLLTADHLAVERATFAEAPHRGLERPYGWGWYLTLTAEVSRWEDPDARGWTSRLGPLADDFDRRLRDWLPLLSHPQRCGLHPNTAFALTRAWPFAVRSAEEGDAGLTGAIREHAERLFAADTAYPLGSEPSAADFLSPGLTEAALMAAVWPRRRFADWLEAFLPGLEEAPNRFRPVVVADPADGHLAHFAGLNLSRAAGMIEVAEALGDEDPRHGPLLAAAAGHLEGSMEAATEGDFMITHWLPAFVILALS